MKALLPYSTSISNTFTRKTFMENWLMFGYKMKRYFVSVFGKILYIKNKGGVWMYLLFYVFKSRKSCTKCRNSYTKSSIYLVYLKILLKF